MMRNGLGSMILSISMLALLGCGDDPDEVGSGTNAGSDSTGPMPWWETTGYGSGPDTVSASGAGPSSASASASTSSSATTAPSDSSDGGESEGEAEGEEDELGIFEWAAVEPGVSFMGMEGEFIAFIGGEELCLIVWDLVSGTPNETCSECDFAYDIVRSEPDVLVDVSCADYIDPAMIPTTLSVGYAPDERLMIYDGAAWVEAGFAEYVAEDGNEFGWFIPYEAK